MKIQIRSRKPWHPYWSGPLPQNAEPLAYIRTEDGQQVREGVLLRLPSGYAIGTARVLTSLPKHDIDVRLAASEMMSMAGKAGTGEAKRRDYKVCKKAGKSGGNTRWKHQRAREMEENKQ